MKKLLLILGLIYSAGFSLLAQSISGYVLFSADKSPVEYGSVVLKTLPDSGFVSGVITYGEGQYNLDEVNPGTYLITANYMGYADAFTEVKVVSGQSVFADTIYLHEMSNKIDEVQVTADFVRGEELVDRTVYNIPPEVVSSSTNGYEVLRKLPSVQVDFNNNITLNGSSNFIIQVDGKQRDKEFLARLKPEDIKSVEIIHNPSGKYDGSIDGVINVVLNPAARVGTSGNVALVVKPFNRGFVFGNAGLDYGREKITYYVSGYMFSQRLANTNSSQYHYRGEQLKDSLINTNGNGDFEISAGALNSGFDYYINDKNNLSLNYSYKPSLMKNSLENKGAIYVDENPSYNQEFLNSNDVESGEHNVSLFYKKKFKKPIKELTFENIVYWFNSNEENAFSSNLKPVGFDTLTSSLDYIETKVNQRQYFNSKLDYVHPLGVSMKLETGYQFYYQDMNFNTKNNTLGINNDFTYGEFRNAAYLSWMWNIKDFGLMATARGEYSDIVINDTTNTDYITFLPSVNLQYKINGDQNIKLTYNSRINRPSIYQLDPFVKLNNLQFISSGNPDLDPERRDRIELKYSANFKKNFIAPYVYHTMVTNKIGTEYTVEGEPGDETSIIRTQPKNILTGYEQGIGVNSMLWYVKLDGFLYRGHYNEYNKDDTYIEAQDYYSYNLTAFTFYQPKKDTLTLYAFVMYQGVNHDAQSTTYSYPVYGCGANYKLKDHTFAINWVFPGTKNFKYSRTVTETSNLYSEATNSFDVEFFVQFVYSYSFKKGKSVKKIGHNANVESDTKGGGIQN